MGARPWNGSQAYSDSKLFDVVLAFAVAQRCGSYFYHRRPRQSHPAAADPALQDGLLEVCERLTGEAISDDRAR